MAIVEKLRTQDKAELIDLIDLVFSQAHCPHDFEKLLPKLYGPGIDTMEHHYAVRENGKLVASILCYPYEVNVGGVKLRAAGIGNVAVHRDARSKGYMKDIMAALLQDLQNNGTDFSWLGGQRQRYQYFGYDLCSRIFLFEVNATNLRHLRGRGYEPAFSFLPFDQASEEQKLAAFALHNVQPVRAERDFEQFEVILKSWDSTPYLVMQNEDAVGYLAAAPAGETGKEMSITECVLAPVFDLGEAVFSFLKVFGLDSVTIGVSENKPERIRQLSAVCEGYRCEYTGNYRIFRFGRVLNAYLTAKADRERLAEGSICIAIGSAASKEILTISVHNGIVKVENGGEPQLSVTNLQGNSFFFGMGGPALACEEAAEYPFLQNWFPLQFGISHQDGV